MRRIFAPEPVPTLDLRGTPCPLNYVRTRLALEKLPPGARLEVDLDGGEPERMVVEGLRAEGHRVESTPLPASQGSASTAVHAVRLVIHRAGA
jgi:TusA-related sulfurtransferase